MPGKDMDVRPFPHRVPPLVFFFFFPFFFHLAFEACPSKYAGFICYSCN